MFVEGEHCEETDKQQAIDDRTVSLSNPGRPEKRKRAEDEPKEFQPPTHSDQESWPERVTLDLARNKQLDGDSKYNARPNETRSNSVKQR